MIYKNLVKCSEFLSKILFEKKYIINSEEIVDLLNASLLINRLHTLILISKSENHNFSKDFRAYREIDNFAENFITCYSTLKRDEQSFKKGYCGLSYGGIELPIIMKSIDDRIDEISILNFNKNVSGYAKKQSLNLRFFDIQKMGGIIEEKINHEKKYVLLDDNLLTGKSMQLALTTFYDIGIEVDKIMVIKYPGVNRINQMFMPNHGALDYRHFFELIQGLYFQSPYSWRDPHSLNQYEDSLGNFDLNRKKILECIAKNGDYSYSSEVLKVKKINERK